MANPKLCHLSLPLFQCSFSFHVLMSNALVFIHAGFVCVTNFVSPVSCFGSLPAFMLAFMYLPFFSFLTPDQLFCCLHPTMSWPHYSSSLLSLSPTFSLMMLPFYLLSFYITHCSFCLSQDSQLEAIVYGLEPYSQYSLRIEALNRAGRLNLLRN